MDLNTLDPGPSLLDLLSQHIISSIIQHQVIIFNLRNVQIIILIVFLGGFGHASHPALMPAGVSAANISHLDQESLPNTDINAYNQVKYLCLFDFIADLKLYL